MTAVGSTTARSATRTLTFGTTYGFRDRARDGAGNWGAFVAGSPITPLRYQETSSKVTFSPSWRRYCDVLGVGRSYPLRDAPRGDGHVPVHRPGGRADRAEGTDPWQRQAVHRWRVCLDDQPVSIAFVPRIVVAARSWSSSGAHTVKLVVIGTARHPRFDVDAFAILR